MIPAAIKQALGRNLMTKEDLIKLVNRLDAVYNCVAHFEALEEKRGYDNGKQFPANLYKGGTQKLLLDHWLSDGPNVFVLDGDGYNFDAGLASCEWAAFLRVRDPGAIVLRVYPKDRAAKVEHILCQLLSSLIRNLTVLVPEKFDKVPDLCKRNFELLAQGGSEGMDAELRILEALPLLELNEGRMLCIVNGLNRAEDGRINSCPRTNTSTKQRASALYYGRENGIYVATELLLEVHPK
ncbi:hypothetical protein RRF57_002275 [Xylaria bambusicola]|uniref:Uncharacterized protein n=1 Tax=Xylaria bambusicola TaxID=326684 RepID=A0AAN7U6P9_9PEZI